jgi:hypothetical protein
MLTSSRKIAISYVRGELPNKRTSHIKWKRLQLESQLFLWVFNNNISESIDFFASTKPLPGGFNEPLFGGSSGDPLPDVQHTHAGHNTQYTPPTVELL